MIAESRGKERRFRVPGSIEMFMAPAWEASRKRENQCGDGHLKDNFTMLFNMEV